MYIKVRNAQCRLRSLQSFEFRVRLAVITKSDLHDRAHDIQTIEAQIQTQKHTNTNAPSSM